MPQNKFVNKPDDIIDMLLWVTTKVYITPCEPEHPKVQMCY